MKNILKFALPSVAFLVSQSTVVFAQTEVVEAWKGADPTRDFVFSTMGGLGVINNSAGFGFVGAVSKKIVNHGFVPDISNQVFIEVEAGPVFTGSANPFWFSTHLRWDFHKDTLWSLYALGGATGQVVGTGAGTSQFNLFLRTGIGAFYHFNEQVSLRAEFSHEFTGLGVTWGL